MQVQAESKLSQFYYIGINLIIFESEGSFTLLEQWEGGRW